MRAVREVLLVGAVAGLLPLAGGLVTILASYAAGVEQAYALWFLAIIVATAFFPLAGTAAAARLIAACLDRHRSWWFSGAVGACLMLCLLLVAGVLRPRTEVAGFLYWIVGAVLLGAAAAALLSLANNWFDRRATGRV